MEPRFGHDFSRVRVHTDARAARSARAVSALAYTVGQDVVFAAGKYAPASTVGRELLAHELTHVVQQSSGPSSAHPRIIPERHPSEREADDLARKVAAEGRVRAIPVRQQSGIALHRLAAPPVAPTPAQIEEMRALFQQVNALVRSGALGAEELAAISSATAEAEAAIVTAGEVAAAGATATAIGEGALGTATVLAADDATGIGVADDVAIPFVLLAAAVGFGVGYLIGSSADEIAAAWSRAADAVARAVRLLREAVARAPKAAPVPVPKQPPAAPEAEKKPQPETEPRPRPFPPVGPDVDVERDTRRGCVGEAIAQRGGNTCHDQFATLISGVTREWGVRTPEGAYATYDALGADRVLYEVKTGYRFLLSTSPSTYTLRERTIHQFIDQSQLQLAVATRCGYPLIWVFNDPAVADFVNGFIQPHVTALRFPCDQDA
jgi:hypothetical protein